MRSTYKPGVPHLIVMLTCNDYTVENAEDVFEQCKDAAATYWGMKEKPLGRERMRALFARMKECGKTTALEVVAYDEAEGLRGAHLAAECGCDILMGTTFHKSIADYCRESAIMYLPFVGDIEGRPSVLRGTSEEMIEQARRAVRMGADGVDLLGYRFEGDAPALNKALVRGVDAPVCIAGSIDSYSRLDEIKEASPWAFTIGSAFFNGCFGGTISSQIDKVAAYIEGK